MNFFGNSASSGSSGSQTDLGSRLYNLKRISIGNEAMVSILPDDNIVQIPVTTFGKSLLSVQDLNTLVSTLNQGDTALQITDLGVGQIDVKLDNTAVFQWKLAFSQCMNELRTLSIIPTTTTADIGGNSPASYFRNAYLKTLNIKNGNGVDSNALSQIILNWEPGVNNYAHSIRTRHRESVTSANAIDFYLWQVGNGITAIGDKHGMSITGTGVGIGTTNPAYPLHIVASGTSGFTNTYDKSGIIITNTSSARLLLESTNNTTGRRIVSVGNDTNAYVVGILNNAGDAWTKSLLISCNLTNYDTTFAGSILPETTASTTLGSSLLKFNNVFSNTFTGSLTGNATSSTSSLFTTIPDSRYISQFTPKRPTSTIAEFRSRPQQIITELCEAGSANTHLGVGNFWGISQTIIPWADPSGGRMFQYYYASDGKVYFRKSDQATPTEAWLPWRDCSPDKCVLTDSTDTITGTKSYASNILPDSTANLRDLGSSSLKFNNLYCNTIPDAPLTRGLNSTIPFLQATNASNLSSQCVLWQHTTNESTPTKFQFLIESKGVNSSPSYERLQISAYREGYKLLHFNPSNKVAIGGDYSATAVTSTLDVGGEMTVRGNIVPEATNTRDIGTTGLAWNGVYCNGLIQPSASNAMTFNCNSAERMRITSAGRVGININNPIAMLDILTNATTIGMQFVGPSEAYDLTTGSSKNQYLPKGIMVNYANQSGSIATTATLIDIGAYSNSANTNCFFGAVSGSVGNGPANFVFGRRTATATWAETMRIDTSGNLCIGTTTATSGSILTVNGNTTCIGNIIPEASGTRDLGSSTKLFNTLYATSLGTSAKPITNLYVGTISQSSTSESLIFKTNSAERMKIDETGRVAIAGDYAMLDAKLDVWGNIAIRGDLMANNSTRNIGNTNTRFLNGYFASLYVTSGVISTSDRNKKKNIEPIQDAISIISKLKPVSYKFIDGTSNRTHTGFIAQDCENIFCENWAGFIKNDNEIGLRYEEFTSINTKAIQELNERVVNLELRKPILFRQDAIGVDNSLNERLSNLEQRLEQESIVEVKEEKSEQFELIQSLMDKVNFLVIKNQELENKIEQFPKVEVKAEIAESDTDGLSMIESLQERLYRSEQQIVKMDKLVKKLVSATNKLIKGNE
jgi:hypothetical protein